MGAYKSTIDVNSRFFRRLTDDEAILRQAIQLRLETRRGTYWDAPGYGLAVEEELEDDLSAERLAALQGEIQAEVQKEERVKSAAVTLRIERLEGGGYSVAPDIRVFPNEGGPFSLVGPILSFGGAGLRNPTNSG